MRAAAATRAIAATLAMARDLANTDAAVFTPLVRPLRPGEPRA